VLIAASLGVPIPEDIPLLTGGYLCHIGLANIIAMVAVGIVGVLSGDLILYSLGRKWGHHIVEHRFVRRLIRPARLLMAERLFNQHGVKIIFAGRFLPGLRPMIFVASGVLKVPFWKFVSVNGFAACISVPLLIVLGVVFGHNLNQLKSDVHSVTQLIVSGILLVGLIAGGIYLLRRQKRMMVATGIDRTIDAQTLAHMPPEGKRPIPSPEKGQDEEPIPQVVKTHSTDEATVNV
jgi:membrane protein DedA with SNARE-associated domain